MVDLMDNLPDEELTERVNRGEQQAFVVLVRRYERSLAALIGRRLGTAGTVDAVEDLLQETLVQAWRGLASQSPRSVRAWLYQVARNRCSDYLRSSQRRERVVDDESLAVMVNRLGATDARQRRVAAEVVETFEAVPARERQALESFYLDGLSIAEIAARHRCAPGTIKRRLSHGRDRVRAELGIAPTRRNTFLDDGFELDWGACPRHVEAGEWLVQEPNGSLKRQPDCPVVFANGAFAVQVGNRTFNCTRVVEMEKKATELDVVIVAYVDDGGRTVLFRRYDGNRRVPHDGSPPREELLPQADRLVIDGMTFVHSYDYVTADACGVP